MLEYLSLLSNFFGLLACCLASWLSLEVCYFPAGVIANPRTVLLEVKQPLPPSQSPGSLGAVTDHSTRASLVQLRS